ncbi:unnamed protein product [Caenorhabditis angaria]|uniref:CUB-like domain-containing protein n=1 Tax=Caenorhabditis angaria TaxID=860376 RepID=A0A9P1N550_9PELO|nr:unnamed protein product [Caenorhabditis angaria]
MTLIILLPIFSLLLPTVHTTYECPSSLTINSSGYVFPNDWKWSTDPAPSYDTVLDCSWTFNIPKGSFAQLLVTAATPAQGSITVKNCVGDREIVPSTASKEPYYFLTPQFTVHLLVSNNVSGTFGFTVKMSEFPSTQPSLFKVTNSPLILTNVNTVLLTSENRVSLIASSASDPTNNSNLRMFAIFDGSDTTAPFMANMRQIVSSRNQLISSGQNLTIVNLVPGTTIGNLIVVQDFSNVQHFNQYKLADCSNKEMCSIGLDARDGMAAVVSVSLEDRYISNIELTSVVATLGVYYGANYTGALEDVPQKFNNHMTTIALNQGSALLEYTTQKVANWNKSYLNRKGFFASQNFGIPSSNQDVSEMLNGKEEFSYGIQIYDNGLIGNATLQIYTYDTAGRTISSQLYNANILPSVNKMTFQCASISFDYMTNGEITTGFNMNFEIQKNNFFDSSANSQVTFFTVLSSIVLMFIF